MKKKMTLVRCDSKYSWLQTSKLKKKNRNRERVREGERNLHAHICVCVSEERHKKEKNPYGCGGLAFQCWAWEAT